MGPRCGSGLRRGCCHAGKVIPPKQEFVGFEFEVFSTERVGLAGTEVGEGHLLNAADPGLDLMNFAGESVWRKPLGHRIGIQERAVNPLRCCPEHSVKSNGGCVVWHIFPFRITTDGSEASGYGKNGPAPHLSPAFRSRQQAKRVTAASTTVSVRPPLGENPAKAAYGRCLLPASLSSRQTGRPFPMPCK